MAVATSGWAFKNDVLTTLNGGLSPDSVDAPISLNTPIAPYNLPATHGPTRLTIADSSGCNITKLEIIEVEWDGFAYQIKGRGLEGTTRQTWVSGSYVIGRKTAEQEQSGTATFADTNEFYGRVYSGELPDVTDSYAVMKDASGQAAVRRIPKAYLYNSSNPEVEPNGDWVADFDTNDWIHLG